MAHKKELFLGWEVETAPLKARATPDAHPCAHPECGEKGLFPAPSTGHSDGPQRRFFCAEHIQEHNRRWDYYAGMSMAEIEEDQRKDRLWRRTTQPMRVAPQDWVKFLGNADTIDDLLGRIHQKTSKGTPTAATSDGPPNTVKEALVILQLSWPCTAIAAKQHYKKLVKTLHPDVRGSDAGAEEAMKRVNVAYALLRRFLGAPK